MQAKLLCWGETDLLCLYGEGGKGTPEAQLEGLILGFDKTLRGHGLGLEDAVFHRLWARDRSVRDGINEARGRLLSKDRRTASSSFISAGRIVSASAVALEMIAFKAKRPQSRRLVDFTPPRRYAHYLVQDDWLFLSGMAEDAPTIDGQFDKAFAQVEAALRREKTGWGRVREATLFLERGKAELRWLEDRFRQAARPLPPRVTIEVVDGLASPEKNLEIEVIAAIG